jgi:hypothetical protein
MGGMTWPIRSLLGPLFATCLGLPRRDGLLASLRVAARRAPVSQRGARGLRRDVEGARARAAAENVPLRTVAKDSGVIASDDFVSPIGVYADCGRFGDERIEGEALVAFTVFVQPKGDSETDIQINAKMRTQAYRRGSSGKLKSDQVYQCVSTGRFEANLGDTVRRLVKP